MLYSEPKQGINRAINDIRIYNRAEGTLRVREAVGPPIYHFSSLRMAAKLYLQVTK